MSIIPAIDRPAVDADVIEEIQIDGLDYVVEADVVLHEADQSRLIVTYGFSIDRTSLTNHGTIWSEGVNANCAYFWNVDFFDNTGLILAEAGAEQAIAIDNPSGTGSIYRNSGTIAAFSGGGAAIVLDDWGATTVANSGLMAAQSGLTARTLMRWNGGETVNLAGGRVLAEGPQAIAIYYRSYADTVTDPEAPLPDVTNAGLIEAASTDPGQVSIAIYGYDLIVGRVFDVVNSGTICADRAIVLEPRDETGPSALVVNEAGGLIDGDIVLGMTHDRIENAGMIVGDIAMGDGDDSFDNTAGTLSGALDLGRGDDLLLGGDKRDVASGDRGDDRMSGRGGSDLLIGDEGNDSLEGGGSADSLHGNAGNDVLDGGAGGDAMYGGDGNDTYYVDSPEDVVSENGGEGADTIRSLVDWRLGANVENLVLAGVAGLSGTGNGLGNVITGNAGANWLAGGGGNDVLRGGAGNDVLRGSQGDDFLSGGSGSDTVSYAGLSAGVVVSLAVETLQDTGGGGLDTLRSISNLIGTDHADRLTGNDSNNVLDGGEGADILRGGLGDDLLNGGLGNDFLNGGSGSDTVSYASLSAGVVVSLAVETLQDTGGGGLDTLRSISNLIGTGQADMLTGNEGSNALDGGKGADILSGGKGGDMLIGGGGADTLTGGGGADRFVFTNVSDSGAYGRDSIGDFRHEQHDLIDLSAIDAIAGGGDDAFTFADAFHGAAGELIVNTLGSGRYLVLGDIDGDTAPDFGIEVFSTTNLTAADFML